MRRHAARVNDAFGNPLVVEMRDFLAHYKIFKQSRATLARFQRILIIVDAKTLIGCQKLVASVFTVDFQIPQFFVVIAAVLFYVLRLAAFNRVLSVILLAIFSPLNLFIAKQLPSNFGICTKIYFCRRKMKRLIFVIQRLSQSLAENRKTM